MPVAVIVPALRPSRSLVRLVARLAGMGFGRLVIVDDGSGAAYDEIFSACAEFPGVEVLRHPENQGKGAALKTGIRHALREYPDLEGVVTADADGQHEPEDIARVAARLAEMPGHLILGSRQFGAHVPWRSRTGNVVTRRLVRLLIGHNLKD